MKLPKLDPNLKVILILWLVCLLVGLFLYLANNARPYGSMQGANWGVAWDFGGYELKGDPGPFLCKSDTHWGTFPWSNSSLAVDC